MSTQPKTIRISARSSALSQAQVKEVLSALQVHHPEVVFEPTLVKTTGDIDQKTSLRSLDKTDFFTKEIDELVLNGSCQVGVHSAKDLPDPLPKGLHIVALTRGVDPSDALVLRHGETLESLPSHALIATSSERREAAVKMLRPDLAFADVRGTIEQRIAKLERGEADGVVVAEAALIRLGLTHLNRIRLPGETVANQGRLAIVARKEDREMAALFSCLDARQPLPAVLYLGLNPPPSLLQSYQVIHYPVIKILPAPMTNPDIQNALLKLSQFTDLIFTSKTAVELFLRNVQSFYGDSRILQGKGILAIGQSTASALKREGLQPRAIAEEETSEGVVALLGKENLDQANILWPHSALSRPVIADYLRERKIDFMECSLYTTHSYCAEPLPDLNAVQEIIFTSPSTVDGFCAIFGPLPKDKTLTCIGPVTEAHLKSVARKSG